MGELARALKMPAVVGEIGAGLLLGPTVLGRIAPGAPGWLFPATGGARAALDGLRLVSVALLMLVAGLEIDPALLRRMGRRIAGTAAGALLVPFALGFGLALGAPGLVGGGGHGSALAFAIFFGAALAISALPTIARTLMDLRLAKTDLGVEILASAMLDDVFGWVLFSVVLGLSSGDGHGASVGPVLAGIVGFALVVFVVVRPLLDRAVPWSQAQRSPVVVLAPLLATALLGAAVTEALGTHAVLGAFFVGVAVRSDHLRENVLEIVHEFVLHVFAPLYFATIGIRVDFLASFSWQLAGVVFALACCGKLAGAFLGARLAGHGPRQARAIAAALNARGAMEIVLGELAVQHGIIGPELFTAIVVMAVGTSLLAGPGVTLALGRRRRAPDLAELVGTRIVCPLLARSPGEAIAALARVASIAAGVDFETATLAALERERLGSTAVGHEVAIPHARLAGVGAPVVALGILPAGIDWDAPDGSPARIVALVLGGDDDGSRRLEALRALALALEDEGLRARLLETRDPAAVREALAERAAEPRTAFPGSTTRRERLPAAVA